ncbi:unnamed protein product [Periconia digitata]|uniref:Methyltransferase domain-containing protein n=1 Tax=Periconia digitata TaxID=1303443 RepID=A0A9W4XW61_9PLEO|nr:unnamed protein product [Periconia digitata]
MSNTAVAGKVTEKSQNPEKWLIEEPPTLTPEARALFEKYSKNPHHEVIPHIKAIRDNAFQIYPYPCLGRWAFLDLRLRQSPQYPQVLSRIKNGDRYLDIGCCIGQDIRSLVADGAPSENTYGSDMKGDFIDVGYALFRDRATLKTTFIEADIFDADSELNSLEGTVDIVHAASFFHLFDWDEQIKAAKCVVRLLKARPYSMVVGRQLGHVDARPMMYRFISGKPLFRHNVESFARFWKQVGDETGTTWKVEAGFEQGLDDYGEESEMETEEVAKGERWLVYSVCML